MFRKTLIARCLTLLVLALLSTNLAWGKEGDILAEVQGTGSSYGRQTTTDSYNVGWVTIGQNGYLGINSANNNTGAKAGVNPIDLPVAQAVNASATSSTSTTSNSCTGYYTFYTTTALKNVGSIEFYYSANSGNSNATAYVVMGDVKSASGGAAYVQVPLATSSTSKQGVNLGTSGTFTFTFAETQKDAKYYGVVIATSSYKRMTGGKITIKEGAGDTPSAELESIAISGTPTKTTYEAGESFDPAGLVVTGTYTEGDPEVITSGIDWTITPNPLTAGTTSVSVTATVDKITSPAYQVNGLTVTEFVQTYANTYTSDASLSSLITGSKVKWEGCKVTDGYDALKIAKGGSASITVPAGTKTVHLHMVAWNGESADVAVKLGETPLSSIKPTADAGVANNSPFTLTTEPKTENSYYFAIEVNADEATTLSLTTASSKRAILFGVNFEADTKPSIEADVEEIEFEQKELSGTVTDSKVISATGKNLTAAISASMKSGSAAVFSVTPVGTPTAAAGDFTVSYSATEAGEYAGTVVLSSGETSIEIPVSASVVADIPVLKSITVSGTPTKMEYTVGDAFETAGLVVTGTYDIGEPQVITEGIEWTVTPSGALTAGTTSVSVTAKVGEVESPAYQVNGLTVKAALPKITITADKIAEFGSSYTEYTWTANDVSGKCWAYRGGSEGSYNIQFNKTTYVYNTTAVPGRITSVKMTKVSGTTRSWSIYGADEALTGDNYTTAGTQIGSAQEVSDETGTTWNVPNDKNYTYFYITKADGGTNIGEIVISYEEDKTPSISADVEKIEFEQKELSGTVTDNKTISATGKNLTAPISASMKDGSAAVFSVTPVGTPTAAAGEFAVSYSTTEAGEYAGTVVLSSGETTLEIPVSASVVAHIPVLQSIAVSGTPTKTVYNEGEEFDPAGLTVTGTYDVGDPQIITEGIEWTVTPSGALAANVTSVSVVATVDGVASEAFNVNITVVELPKWAKVTADKTDWSGEYLLVYEGTGDNAGTAYVWTGVDAANCNATATISNNQITKPADAVSLTIASMDGGYSILVNGGDNDGKYISGKSGSNTVNFGTTASANTLAYSNGNVTITSNTSTIMYNSNSSDNRFRYYKSGSSQKAVQLYEKVLPPTNEAVTFAAPEGGSLVIKNGETLIESGTTIQNGTVLDVEFGMTPAEAYKDVAIKVTKTDGGDDVTSTVYDAETKEITMPRYAITVAVTFTKLYKISLVKAGEGIGSATMNGVTTDIYVDGETQIDLVASAVAPNEFTKWSATSNISINNDSAAETYALASGDGTITATFGISALQPLGTPTLSDPTNITYSGVTLNWQELANAEAYNVELLLNDETVASDVITGETSWTPKVTLQANTTYTYTVQGIGDGVTYAEENNPKATSTFTTDDYPAVVLTLSENGITSTIDGKLNTPIDLPTTSTQTCEDKVFVGWSATTIDGETDAEPSLLGETYTFTNPEQPTATIYAVYAKEAPGESSNWEITSIDKPGSGSGYAPYNGSHTTDNISYTTYQIMMGTGENENKMQFQKNAGMMYNTTPFGDDILFITIADITSNISVYEGSTEIATTPTSGAITLDDGKYTFSKGKKYFHIKMGNATGYSSKITVAVAGAPTYSNYCTTTSIVISENTVWNDDVTINGYTVTIESGVILTVNGALTNDNPENLIIKDGGQLVFNNSGSSKDGDINSGVQATVEKNIIPYGRGGKGWHFLAAPMEDFTVESFIYQANGKYDLYRWYIKDDGTPIWYNYKAHYTETYSETDGTGFEPKFVSGRGYLAAYETNDICEMKGTLNAGTTFSFTVNSKGNFTLLGNPFTYELKWSDFNKTGVYDKGFAVVDSEYGIIKYVAGTTPIKVGTGFMVYTEDDNAGLSFTRGNESGKSNDILALNLFASNGNGEDNTIIVIDDNNGGFAKADNFNTNVPQIYTERLQTKYGIRNFSTNTKEFFVSFKAVGEGSNTIRLETIGEFDYVHLYDKLLDIDVDMLLEGSYTFEASEGDDTHRFIVRIDKGNTGIDENETENFVNVYNGEIHVSGSGEVQIFDVMGRIVHSEVISGDATISTGGFKGGVYVVRLIGNGWTKTEKIVVRR